MYLPTEQRYWLRKSAQDTTNLVSSEGISRCHMPAQTAWKMCHVCATVLALSQCDQLLLAFGLASPFSGISTSSYQTVVCLPHSHSWHSFLLHCSYFMTPHTRFTLNVNTQNITVVLRASRFPSAHISAAHICVLVGASRYKVSFELPPFPLGHTNNKCVCFESCVLCTARNMIGCLSVTIFQFLSYSTQGYS